MDYLWVPPCWSWTPFLKNLALRYSCRRLTISSQFQTQAAVGKAMLTRKLLVNSFLWPHQDRTLVLEETSRRWLPFQLECVFEKLPGLPFWMANIKFQSRNGCHIQSQLRIWTVFWKGMHWISKGVHFFPLSCNWWWLLAKEMDISKIFHSTSSDFTLKLCVRAT